jgi:hypothetical protein
VVRSRRRQALYHFGDAGSPDSNTMRRSTWIEFKNMAQLKHIRAFAIHVFINLKSHKIRRKKNCNPYVTLGSFEHFVLLQYIGTEAVSRAGAASKIFSRSRSRLN